MKLIIYGTQKNRALLQHKNIRNIVKKDSKYKQVAIISAYYFTINIEIFLGF